MNTGEIKVKRHHIVAMPYPGRGHINPMINLCSLLATSNDGITITFVLTEEWLAVIGSLPNIHLRSIPNVIPSEHNRAANFVAFLDAVFSKMEAPFDRLLDRLDPPPSCIVADAFLPWMVTVGRRRSIPVVSLSTMAPSTFSLFYHFDLLADRGHSPEECPPEEKRSLTTFLECLQCTYLTYHQLPLASLVFSKHILETFSSATKAQAILFTSFYDLQPHLINTLRAKIPIPIYTIGPSIPYLSLKVPPADPIPNGHMASSHWLDSHPEASILYVSLGSYLVTSKEQMRELSIGLRASGVKFLWVARDEAFSLREACGEMGRIVPWCDQLRVLCHSSVGGFLTHCGWNSTMESIFAGIPMLTFPLFADQILNSKLIVEDWKVGLKLKQRKGAENVVGREEISRRVKRLMDLNGEEGKELRRRAKELQETCRRAIEIGGSSDTNITAFVEEFIKGQCNNAM